MPRQNTQPTCIKMPRALRDSLAELAEMQTQSYTAGRISLENRFGDVAPDRKRLPLWFPIAKLVEKELKRLERRSTKSE